MGFSKMDGSGALIPADLQSPLYLAPMEGKLFSTPNIPGVQAIDCLVEFKPVPTCRFSLDRRYNWLIQVQSLSILAPIS